MSLTTEDLATCLWFSLANKGHTIENTAFTVKIENKNNLLSN